MKPDDINYLRGDYRASRHPDFRRINKKFTDGNPRYLLKEVAQAYEKMAQAAYKDNVHLKIVSGFRSFLEQKYIWEGKLKGHRLSNNVNLLKKHPKDIKKRVRSILLYSSAPGTSRHHWGTDFDLNSLDPKYFDTKDGEKVYSWLKENAGNYGFIQPYTAGRKAGYSEEKWHWSYKPISDKLLLKYKEFIPANRISGFEGSKHLPSSFYKDYILSINHEYH